MWLRPANTLIHQKPMLLWQTTMSRPQESKLWRQETMFLPVIAARQRIIAPKQSCFAEGQ